MMRSAPAALRNRGPIADVTAPFLPTTGVVLEISSGTGEHAVYFAARFPHLVFQPSDVDAAARASIAAHISDCGHTNVRAPLDLDVLDDGGDAWTMPMVDALLNFNMIHIAPPDCIDGLFCRAARVLKNNAPLVMYGPYRRRDVDTAPSNEAFDASLRARNPTWGLRQLEDVIATAVTHGFAHTHTIEMPANNLVVIYRRRAVV